MLLFCELYSAHNVYATRRALNRKTLITSNGQTSTVATTVVATAVATYNKPMCVCEALALGIRRMKLHVLYMSNKSDLTVH